MQSELPQNTLHHAEQPRGGNGWRTSCPVQAQTRPRGHTVGGSRTRDCEGGLRASIGTSASRIDRYFHFFSFFLAPSTWHTVGFIDPTFQGGHPGGFKNSTHHSAALPPLCSFQKMCHAHPRARRAAARATPRQTCSQNHIQNLHTHIHRGPTTRVMVRGTR